MFGELLAYAQTFERSNEFRSEMVPERGGQPAGPTRALDTENFQLPTSERNDRNPFKFVAAPHTVEKGLESAKRAAGYNDRETFNTHGKTVLDYLEPQYRRIAAAYDRLGDFLAGQALPGKLLLQPMFCT